MRSIVSAKGWEDYAVRSSAAAESREIEPYGYGIGLDESVKKSIEGCHYHGQQGQEIRLTFDQTGIILNFGQYNGFTVFSRLGNVTVDEGSGPKAYATSVPYSLTMGRRSYFGREDDQCPPIWLYDPLVGCLDLSYAYHEGYLGDNQINHIAHQFYAYRLDCVQDKQDFATKYRAGWDINFRIPVRYSPTQEARDLFEKPILG